MKDKLKGEYLYRVQSRRRSIPIYGGSQDRLRFLSIPLINHIKGKDGDLSDFEIKATSLGIDVPPRSQKIDPDMKILIRENIEESKFPGIVIQKGNKEVVVPCGFTEGLFIYTCTLLFKIENKEFKKIDFMSFLCDIYKYKNVNRINIGSMPESLKEQYSWYENVFNALYQKNETVDNLIAYDYKGNLSFEEWCITLLKKTVKSDRTYKNINDRRFPSDSDPIRQGIYRIRKNLNKSLKSPEFEGLVSKIDLGSNIKDKGKPYKLYIDKDNIFFPNTEKWDKVVKDKSHLKDTSSHKISE